MLLTYAPQAVHDALDKSIASYVKAAQIIDRIHGFKAPPGGETTREKQLRTSQDTLELMGVVLHADENDQALANTIRA